MIFLTWNVAALRSRARPLSEGAAALPWRAVCMWATCGKCLPCVAWRLPRQCFWGVVHDGLRCAPLARERAAHSAKTAPAARVGFGGCWRCGAVCCPMSWNMVQLAFDTFFKIRGHRHTVRFVGSSSACHCAQRLETPADPWRNILHALSHVGSGIYARFEIRAKWCDRARLRKATPRIHGSRPKHATVVGWRLV